MVYFYLEFIYRITYYIDILKYRIVKKLVYGYVLAKKIIYLYY